jgi:hypothetical protein
VNLPVDVLKLPVLSVVTHAILESNMFQVAAPFQPAEVGYLHSFNEPFALNIGLLIPLLCQPLIANDVLGNDNVPDAGVIVLSPNIVPSTFNGILYYFC